MREPHLEVSEFDCAIWLAYINARSRSIETDSNVDGALMGLGLGRSRCEWPLVARS